MIFAFVMSRFLYNLARDRLERGVSLGTLEQLIGSHTLGSAFQTHFELRILNILGVLLLGAWLLSPLGGQALLRILHEGTRSEEATVVYTDTIRQDFAAWFFTAQLYFGTIFAPLSIKQGPQDLWGNVKIPVLEDNAGSGWTEISYEDTPRYSSLVGIPITNIPTVGNTTFAIESTYVSLSCDPVVLHDEVPEDGNALSAKAFDNLETNLTYIWNKERSGRPNENGTWYGMTHPVYSEEENLRIWWTLGLDRFMGQHWRSKANATANPLRLLQDETDMEAGPTTLLFQARTILFDTQPARAGIYRTECHVVQKYVESRVRCIPGSGSTPQTCQVLAQRPSQKPHAPENVSLLSSPGLFYDITKSLPPNIMNYENNKGDASIMHIFNPAMDEYISLNDTAPDLTKLSSADFDLGLTQIINSFLRHMQLGPAAFSQFWEKDFAVDDQFIELTSQTATAETTHLVYGISWGWMAACLVSCAVLALAGVLGAVFAHKGKGPELLGFVSTILRDSRYHDMPKRGAELGYMDGPELSRLLKHERLRYGHIHMDGTGEVGMGIGREEQVTTLREKSRAAGSGEAWTELVPGARRK